MLSGGDVERLGDIETDSSMLQLVRAGLDTIGNAGSDEDEDTSGTSPYALMVLFC